MKVDKAVLYDGCTRVPDFNFRSCCDIHDEDYTKAKISRLKADIKLFKCIYKHKPIGKRLVSINLFMITFRVEISETVRKLLSFKLALVYFIGVRIFGGSHYKSK